MLDIRVNMEKEIIRLEKDIQDFRDKVIFNSNITYLIITSFI